MSKADVEAHQARHGFLNASPASQKVAEPVKLPKPRMNRTEAEYGLILEAMKRRGLIIDYRPFGMKLAWGADPATGKPMYYTADFLIFDSILEGPGHPTTAIRLLEIKGNHIYPQDWIRFKGCRAAWPMFRFELHQKTKEGWRQLL